MFSRHDANLYSNLLISRLFLQNFYQANYIRANLVIGMAGGFSDDFSDKVNADMNSLPPGTANEHVVPRQGTPPGARAVLVERPSGATTIQFGFPIAVTRSHPDYAALLVINSYFGVGLTSRLFLSLRESRGLTYSPRSFPRYYGGSVLRGRQEQIFQVYISEVDSIESAHFATRVAMYEFNKLMMNGLSEESFDIQRGSFINSLNLLAQTQSSLLDDAMDDEYHGMEEGFVAYMTTELESLTVDKVNEVITMHLQDQNVSFVFVTSDATDLRNRLIDETISTVTYPSDPPFALIEEDSIISNWTLGFDAENVQIIPVAQVFETMLGNEVNNTATTGGGAALSSSSAQCDAKFSSLATFIGFLTGVSLNLF